MIFGQIIINPVHHLVRGEAAMPRVWVQWPCLTGRAPDLLRDPINGALHADTRRFLRLRAEAQSKKATNNAAVHSHMRSGRRKRKKKQKKNSQPIIIKQGECFPEPDGHPKSKSFCCCLTLI